jgi:Family of unknown function (DUF6152)
MTYRHALVLAAVLFALSDRVAVAHHAFSPVYDEARTITIKGVVTEFRLINPHAMITLDVVDAAGKHVAWTVEMAGLLSLSRVGWTKNTVSAGDQLTVIGNPTHTGSPRIFFTRMVFPNGKEMIGPGAGDVSAIEEQRRQRARERSQKK